MFDELTGREAHPVLAMPSPRVLERVSVEDQEVMWQSRREAMLRMLVTPLSSGYEPKSWERADRALKEFREEHPVGVLIFLVLGGHRAGKTEWRSKRSVQGLFENSDYKIWACQATQEASREAQQVPIYKYLPPEYKVESGKLRKGRKLKVNYTPWGGFTEDVFAVENRFGGTSECRFKFYSMDPRSLEGAEINEAWCDEEATLEWLEACLYRLVSRNGILFITFTPRWGYTSTVKALLSGAVTLEEGEADAQLLAVRDGLGQVIGPRKVPLVQENLAVQIPGHQAKGRIVYFHSCENPFPLGNWANMKETLRGASEDKILTTAYGVPTKSMMSLFPMFKDSVHVVSVNRFKEIEKGGGIWYHFLDPCSGRNWFQIWVFIDGLNRAFVAGESPSFGHQSAYIPGVGDPGPWAVPSGKADGDMGDGQKEWGWGFSRYLDEIDRVERLLSGGESENRPATYREPLSRTDGTLGSRNVTAAQKITVAARWIDARYGNARKTSEERSVTTIEELSELGMEFFAAPSEKYIDGGREGGTGSIRMINDRLFYDPQRPVDLTNTPKLFVVETCPNTIWALKEWTGRDGGEGACKDPIDCLRMYVLSGVGFVDESMLTPRKPWSAQFGR
jgi:hypothetical protein